MNYPKPNIVRLAEGDRGHRTKKQKEKFSPMPEVIPDMPKGLSGKARIYWEKYVSLFHITEADVPRFEYLCNLDAEIRELQKDLKNEGRYFLKVTVDGAGIEHQEKKSHPAFSQQIKLRQEKRILEREFSARYSGVTKKKDEMEEMID